MFGAFAFGGVLGFMFGALLSEAGNQAESRF
jgi:hypothetical protein